MSIVVMGVYTFLLILNVRPDFGHVWVQDVVF